MPYKPKVDLKQVWTDYQNWQYDYSQQLEARETQLAEARSTIGTQAATLGYDIDSPWYTAQMGRLDREIGSEIEQIKMGQSELRQGPSYQLLTDPTIAGFVDGLTGPYKGPQADYGDAIHYGDYQYEYQYIHTQLTSAQRKSHKEKYGTEAMGAEYPTYSNYDTRYGGAMLSPEEFYTDQFGEFTPDPAYALNRAFDVSQKKAHKASGIQFGGGQGLSTTLPIELGDEEDMVSGWWQ